jgi:hypothetical protein
LNEYYEVTNGLLCELKDWFQKKIVPDMLEPVTPLGGKVEWLNESCYKKSCDISSIVL